MTGDPLRIVPFGMWAALQCDTMRAIHMLKFRDSSGSVPHSC